MKMYVSENCIRGSLIPIRRPKIIVHNTEIFTGDRKKVI